MGDSYYRCLRQFAPYREENPGKLLQTRRQSCGPPRQFGHQLNSESLHVAADSQRNLSPFTHPQLRCIYRIQRDVGLRHTFYNTGRKDAQFLEPEDVIERNEKPFTCSGLKRFGVILKETYIRSGYTPHPSPLPQGARELLSLPRWEG